MKKAYDSINLGLQSQTMWIRQTANETLIYCCEISNSVFANSFKCQIRSFLGFYNYRNQFLAIPISLALSLRASC